MEFDLENPLTDTITSLFLIETDHMPLKSYFQSLQTRDFDATIRSEALSLISQFSYNFDPFISYLAVNYFDRFFSSQGMPVKIPTVPLCFSQRKAWILSLLAVSCVSLAAKMKKTEFSLTDLQCDEGFIFDTKTIERMEVIILGELQWRMRSITPFSFINFFISLFNLKDPPLTQLAALKARATEIIFKAQKEIRLLEFKPSIIAASAILSASRELFPLQFPCFTQAISNCSYVNKESVLRCYNTMEDILTNGYETILNMVSSSDTPANVLDHRHCWSSQSEMTTSSQEAMIPVSNTIDTTIIRPVRDIKRRKLSELRKDNSFQLSQIQRC